MDNRIGILNGYCSVEVYLSILFGYQELWLVLHQLAFALAVEIYCIYLMELQWQSNVLIVVSLLKNLLCQCVGICINSSSTFKIIFIYVW